MLNKDVRELYKIVPVGTTVSIIHNNPAFRKLYAGAAGSDVQKLQRALSKLGYYKGGADARFGNGLKSAVVKFQKDNKLKGTGTVDRRTWDLIMGKSNSLGSQQQAQ